MPEILFVPVILFMLIVAPLWLVLHYVTRWRATKTLSSEDEKMLVDLWQSAKRMESRIAALETILDHDAPGWRGRAE
ncbi:MAG TPA: envelope stress response membrane protein PspB [Alphaproteobacteria bacterium]|nr:envelope stress response membrane protein PspB [Alphaproteobacteria bacterium]